MRVIVERGPKGKKTAAVAWDWPGLARGGKTEEAAVSTLNDYVQRYLSVAKRARLGTSLTNDGALDIVDRYEGTGSTDFYGISFASNHLDREPMDDKEFDRRLKLLRACWDEFDDIAARVSPVLKKGPRGGGRDRDQIIAHVRNWELEGLAKQVGIHTPWDEVKTPHGLIAFRDEYVDALRSAHRAGTVLLGKKGRLSHLVRHTAYHVMDHAWEMEDKDLTDVENADL